MTASRPACRPAPVLWYVHDHGSGHLARARAVIPHLRHHVVVAAGPGIAAAARRTLDVPVVALPSDVPTGPTATVGPWHHAPAGPAVRARSLALAEVIAAHDCTVAVVDVSMEVAALARLCGLRVVAVRQSGRRADPAHRIGLGSADVVWVPQHRRLEPLGEEEELVDRRWHFTGAFSRLDGHRSCPTSNPRPSGRRRAVVLLGAGGNEMDLAAWRATGAPKGWQVVVAGAQRWCDGPMAGVGHIDDVGPLLGTADLVITSAGWASVADAAAVGAPLVVVPEPRPFDEQVVRAGALADAGLAVVRPHWPGPDELDSLHDLATERSAARSPGWSAYYDGRGAERAARLIDGEVAR